MATFDTWAASALDQCSVPPPSRRLDRTARARTPTSGGAFEWGGMATAAQDTAFYTVEEVAKHRSKTDCWVIVHAGALAHDASVCNSPLVPSGTVQ